MTIKKILARPSLLVAILGAVLMLFAACLSVATIITANVRYRLTGDFLFLASTSCFFYYIFIQVRNDFSDFKRLVKLEVENEILKHERDGLLRQLQFMENEMKNRN